MNKLKVNGTSRPCGSSAAIKEQISTSIVGPIIAVSPENVLVSHSTHHLIVDVQPSFTTTVATAPYVAITVRVEYIERIVSTARKHTVVVEHAIERVTRGLGRSSCRRGHNVYISRTTRYPQLRLREKKI